MNRHLWGLYLLMLVVGLGGKETMGQSSPSIPTAALTAANVQPHLAAIQEYVRHHVAQLASDSVPA